MRIVVDTNIWISFIISKKLEAFSNNVRVSSIQLLLSKQMIQEVFSTAVRPKFHSVINNADILLLRSIFSKNGVLIDVNEVVSVCRDPKDDFLLSLALSGKADYLITGDKDLLVLNNISETRIITYSEWLKLNDK
ncbi:putative toxin-antitoxin system toxin component, PIN family [Owenweeksia hongkongensis]|uniref:putative toxin-antitoxin system toxin component, PIN family n=1 Tax=Owenweeksia hongkongensis TaxID=253245 RepID=UPI003A927E10